MIPIDGVTVISTVDNTVNVPLMVVFVLLLSVIVGVVFQVIFDINSTNVFRSAVFSGIAFCFIMCIYFAIKPPQQDLCYEVVVDETVSMSEFFDKYDVISIDGNVYTIKEKQD